MAPKDKSKKTQKMEGPNHSKSKHVPSKHVSSTSSTPANAAPSPPSVGHQSDRPQAPSSSHITPNAAQRSLNLPPLNTRGTGSQNSSRSGQNSGRNQLTVHSGQCPQHLLRHPTLPSGQIHRREQAEDDESSDEEVSDDGDEAGEEAEVGGVNHAP